MWSAKKRCGRQNRNHLRKALKKHRKNKDIAPQADICTACGVFVKKLDLQCAGKYGTVHGE